MVTWEDPFKCPKCKTNLWPVGESGLMGPYHFERFRCGSCEKEYYWIGGPSMDMYVEAERFKEVEEQLEEQLKKIERTGPKKPRREGQRSLLEFMKR